MPAHFGGKWTKNSAYSLSPSTLRLLAILADLLEDNPAQLYCFDPLETEIHPTRLHLLVAMIEGVAKSQNIQILGTTHSSKFLRLLGPETREYVSLIYRLETRSDAGIVRILDLADARRAIEEYDLGSLHESAWLENVAEFVLDDELKRFNLLHFAVSPPVKGFDAILRLFFLTILRTKLGGYGPVGKQVLVVGREI